MWFCILKLEFVWDLVLVVWNLVFMTSDEIKKIIHEMLERLSIAVERLEVSVDADGRERFSIQTPDSHLLIGPKGAHLFALNHLVKKIVGKDSKDAAAERQFHIDVNDYQAAATANLKNLAAIMGGRARSFKTNMELPPMSSYERMVVHSFFQDAQDLKTESVGDGERRRVVIKYTGE